MSPLNDHTGIGAAVVLTRTAAEESEGPGEMIGRMSKYIDGPVEGNGRTATTGLATAMARQHFIALDTLATRLNLPAGHPAGCLGSSAVGKPR